MMKILEFFVPSDLEDLTLALANSGAESPRSLVSVSEPTPSVDSFSFNESRSMSPMGTSWISLSEREGETNTNSDREVVKMTERAIQLWNIDVLKQKQRTEKHTKKTKLRRDQRRQRPQNNALRGKPAMPVNHNFSSEFRLV